ncbi:hypothetical protein CLV51_1011051 [Chitinophaga niastensis]|uniref:Uncharacterized protein n=1 Tax=Chitinophaga niastensis TaxID=536980 RepID=A0A2P8HU13_CHINA|nr:hypothetical protein [Chitinophaga niastensis]PSL49716.1 hypothetical protein CLV51_1011051 [Chitinophaga niastensis]
MKYLSFLIFSLCISCGSSPSTNKSGPPVGTTTTTAIKSTCTEADALHKITMLPELIAIEKMIDTISNHKQHVSYVVSTDTIDGRYYYQFQAGYENTFRRENYFNFYVDKSDCSTIKVFEPIQGDIIPLEEWRKVQDQTEKKGAATKMDTLQ